MESKLRYCTDCETSLKKKPGTESRYYCPVCGRVFLVNDSWSERFINE